MSDHSLSFMEDQDDDAPRGGRGEKRRNRWLLFTVLGILVALVLGSIGVAAWYGKSAFDALDNISRDPGLMPTGQRPAPVEPVDAAKAPINMVLMGSDTRGGERGRSDVLQLLHISGDRQNVFLMSIPRDSYVEIPGRGKAKINAAYSWGGAPLAVETMELLLDVPMDHTVLIDFEGFKNVIDSLGGVTVVNKEASSSDGFDFPKGEITLDGEAALRFVRERKNLSNGDFGRAERQRDVIKAVLSKLASGGVLADPGRFRESVTELGKNFTVDDGLTNDEIIRLGWELKGVHPADIKSFQLPTAGFGWTADKQSIVLVDEKKLDELKTALRADDMLAFYESVPN
ncbi:MAG: LCP family protein [Tessaracoccus sp.]|uniref:LCP family protein n=1 Tax=Tessaracoccus sp. TaxID=1971211 RepID=UPI001EC1CDFC|nr:LCP family protein [Tessaracoccus sp.]MBK7820195.1 LCP family protein [Tessaracoccus sp.]